MTARALMESAARIVFGVIVGSTGVAGIVVGLMLAGVTP